MKLIASLILCCLAAAPLRAQTPAPEKEPPPSGPMLARAPEFARWNFTTKRQSAGPAGAHPGTPAAKADETVYEVTKTGKVYLQKYTDGLGRNWVNWTADKMTATIWPETGVIILQCRISGLAAPDYTKADFPGVGWVAESNFIKTAAYKGKKCLIFSQTTTVPDREQAAASAPKPGGPNGPAGRAAATAGAPSPTRQIVQTALIDYESRLPLYAQDADANYTFEYLRPPEAMLQVPAEIEKVAQQQARVSADLVRTIPRAF